MNHEQENLKYETQLIEDFVEYVHSFYGKAGIYQIRAGVTFDEIKQATETLIERIGYDNFCADSVDRERVRDILLSE